MAVYIYSTEVVTVQGNIPVFPEHGKACVWSNNAIEERKHDEEEWEDV